MSENLPTNPGRWLPGQSGNPAGRPKGSKNHLVELKQQLEIAVRDHLQPVRLRQILDKMIDMAVEGHVGAAKLVLDKVLSNAKDTEDSAETGGTFIFQVKNLTLKHPDLESEPQKEPPALPVITVQAEPAEFTPVEEVSHVNGSREEQSGSSRGPERRKRKRKGSARRTVPAAGLHGPERASGQP